VTRYVQHLSNLKSTQEKRGLHTSIAWAKPMSCYKQEASSSQAVQKYALIYHITMKPTNYLLRGKPNPNTIQLQKKCK